MTSRTLTGKAAIEALKQIIQDRNAVYRTLRLLAEDVTEAKTSRARTEAIGALRQMLRNTRW